MNKTQIAAAYSNAGSPKILLTGGSGALGSCIRKLVPCAAPSSKELDIANPELCRTWIKRVSPDIIFHSAAYTSVDRAEIEKEKCWNVNVLGTENLAKASRGIRFVYISTAYVFDGDMGNYTEIDTPSPANFYSLTKLLGEMVVRQHEPHLIIRTMFKKDGPWPFEKAFTDQWSTAEFASDLAPELLFASLHKELTGVLHISGEKRTIYELAKRVSPNVGKRSITELPVKLPRDVSLDHAQWNAWKATLKKQGEK